MSGSSGSKSVERHRDTLARLDQVRKQTRVDGQVALVLAPITDVTLGQHAPYVGTDTQRMRKHLNTMDRLAER